MGQTAGVPLSMIAGPNLVAIPGPSVVPERVLAAMHRPMPDIYAGELLTIVDEVWERLPGLVRTTTARPFLTIGNGHSTWATAMSNTLSRGDKVLVLECGRFGAVWADMARFDGLDVELLVAERGMAIDPAVVAARLAADPGRAIKAVMLAQTDTASSVRNDIAAIRGVLDTADHPALLMVDGIASIGCERFEMDALGVDVALAASQKGLMTPPGLGLVWAGPRALAAHRRADMRTQYWDWTTRDQAGPMYLRFCGTPPVSLLYGLREALAMIDEEGLDAVWARHQVLADAVRAAVAAWSVPDGIGFHAVHAAERGNSVTTVESGSIDARRLSAVCRDQLGVTLGVGLGDLDGCGFRIAHMGHASPSMVLGVLGVVETALGAMGTPVGGSGVAAAAAVIGSAVAS